MSAFPRPVVMDGERLPASYANFYIANGAVIVPTFNDPNDRIALSTLADLFPEREVVGIHAVDLVWGLGTIHCLTQQQPAAAQQEKCDEWKRDEEQSGIERLARYLRHQKRREQKSGERERQISAPALVIGVEAVDQLHELGLDEGPAGADRMARLIGETCSAIAPLPDSLDQ